MIYTASLALPVGGAFGKQARQSTVNKICDNMNLDPDTTTMDSVILGPKDLLGPKAIKISQALNNVHPDICIIYMYTKDDEADLIDVPNKFKCKKIDKSNCKEAFEKFAHEHQIRQGKQRVASADFEVTPVDDESTPEVKPPSAMRKGRFSFGKFRKEESKPKIEDDVPKADMGPQHGDAKTVEYDPDALTNRYVNQGIRIDNTGKAVPLEPAYDDQAGVGEPGKVPEGLLNFEKSNEHQEYSTESNTDTTTGNTTDLPDVSKLFRSDVASEDTSFQNGTPSFGTPMPVADLDKPTTNTMNPGTPTLEESLASINNYEDWSLFKEKLNHDSIVGALIQENSEYVGLMNMVDVMDKRIETVWRDTALDANAKFEKIKEIGLEKAAVRAASNSIHVQKVISIISTIVLSAKRTVEEKVNSVDTSLFKISSDSDTISDTRYIDQLIAERTKVQMNLLSLSRDIVDLDKSIEDLVNSELKELDAKLPSASAFINDMVKPVGVQIFTPTNTAILANRLLRLLQENRIVTSEIEELVQGVINQLFQLCERDEDTIRYMQNTINLLKANRVEDVVIVDTLLKNILRLYVGDDNSGRSATAITWCGILSRRQNSLLIDLTGRSKFREYGITPISLDEFLSNRIEQQFLCVESDKILNPEELQKLVDELKLRLNYYPYVNVIVAPEDIAGLTQLSDEAKCVHYITNCTIASLNTMRKVIRSHTSINIARKLVTIDSPVSPLMIADMLRCDPTITKLVTLPSITAIRACAIRHDRPYEYSDVTRAFEEAFR